MLYHPSNYLVLSTLFICELSALEYKQAGDRYIDINIDIDDVSDRDEEI